MGLADISKDMSHFKEFKQTVIEKLTENLSEECIVEKVLPHFEEVIASNFTYQQIMECKSLARLFEVLECRDELAVDNIRSLRKIASLINCIRLEATFIQYEKLQPQAYCCAICNHSYEQQTSSIIIKTQIVSRPLSPKKDKKCIEKEDESMDSDDESEIVIAFQKIARSIGAKWKDIARALKLKEGDIDEIEYDNRLLTDKVYKMLNLWLQTNGNRATIQKLKKALVNARRRDLADKL